MRPLTIDDFASWLNEACEIAHGDARLTMSLCVVEPLEGGAREAGAFRLEFRGPPSPILAQGTMRVSRSGFDHEIFIVPVANDAQETRYEAIFY